MQTYFCRKLPVVALVAPLGLILGSGPSTAADYRLEEVRPIWSKIDLNADGAVSRDELREEDLALLAKFDKADINRDGKLSLRELEILLIAS